MKICLLLAKHGFLEKNGKMCRERNWIEEVCSQCPLTTSGQDCVYEKAGAVSKEDRITLLMADNLDEPMKGEEDE